MRKILQRLPKYSVVPILLCIVWNFFVFYLAKLIGLFLTHYDFTIALDSAIPFLPWTVVFYVVSFPFWIACYYWIGTDCYERVMKLFCADFIVKSLCLALFIIIPTAKTRPEIAETDFFSWSMSMVYFFDTPTNLLPSIHCINSFLCALGVTKHPSTSGFVKACVWLLAILIFMSTLTTKQHVIIDVVFGIIFSIIAYYLTENSKVMSIYKSIIAKLEQAVARFLH